MPLSQDIPRKKKQTAGLLELPPSLPSPPLSFQQEFINLVQKHPLIFICLLFLGRLINRFTPLQPLSLPAWKRVAAQHLVAGFFLFVFVLNRYFPTLFP